MSDQMRVALETTKSWILKEYSGATDHPVVQQIEEALKSSEAEPLIGMSDADLKRVVEESEKAGFQKGYTQRHNEEVSERAASASQVQIWIKAAYDEGKSDRENETVIQLLELPGQIKGRQQTIADSSREIEKLRLKIAHARNNAFEFISGIKEGDKLKYSNEKARNVAQESHLAEDREYLDDCDALGRQEWQLKVEQIELDHLRDLFRAYLAIAGMQGVR